MYEIRFRLTEKTNACKNEGELKNDLSEFFLLKDKLKLDFHILNFEQQCHRVNQILNKCNFFLKVYELKEKFRSLIKHTILTKKCRKGIIWLYYKQIQRI